MPLAWTNAAYLVVVVVVVVVIVVVVIVVAVDPIYRRILTS